MTDTPTKPKAKPNLGAEKLTPEEQRRRFEALAEEAGCDEGSEVRFEAAIRTIGRARGGVIQPVQAAPAAKRSEAGD